MHLMHPPSAVSCSPQRHPLLPPCTAQSEAFSRDVRANRPALGWEPEARSIYTAGLIESAHTHTRVRKEREAPRPASAATQLTHSSGANGATVSSLPTPLPLWFLHHREHQHHHLVRTNYSDEDRMGGRSEQPCISRTLIPNLPFISVKKLGF